MKELRRQFSLVAKRLPESLALPALENDLIRAAANLHVQISNLDFGAAIDQEFYSRQPFRLEASGRFHDLYYFLYDVFYAAGNAVSLGDFVIRRSPEPDELLLTLDGSLYRLNEPGA